MTNLFLSAVDTNDFRFTTPEKPGRAVRVEPIPFLQQVRWSGSRNITWEGIGESIRSKPYVPVKWLNEKNESGILF